MGKTRTREEINEKINDVGQKWIYEYKAIISSSGFETIFFHAVENKQLMAPSTPRWMLSECLFGRVGLNADNSTISYFPRMTKHELCGHDDRTIVWKAHSYMAGKCTSIKYLFLFIMFNDGEGRRSKMKEICEGGNMTVTWWKKTYCGNMSYERVDRDGHCVHFYYCSYDPDDTPHPPVPLTFRKTPLMIRNMLETPNWKSI